MTFQSRWKRVGCWLLIEQMYVSKRRSTSKSINEWTLWWVIEFKMHHYLMSGGNFNPLTTLNSLLLFPLSLLWSRDPIIIRVRFQLIFFLSTLIIFGFKHISFSFRSILKSKNEQKKFNRFKCKSFFFNSAGLNTVNAFQLKWFKSLRGLLVKMKNEITLFVLPRMRISLWDKITLLLRSRKDN